MIENRFEIVFTILEFKTKTFYFFESGKSKFLFK